MDNSSFWVLTADRKIARVFEGSHVQHGRIHIEQRAELVEEWDEFQHGRPSPRVGKDHHSYASQGHEDDERLRRFAKKVATWLEHELKVRKAPRMHAFAARRFLGELRKAIPSTLHARVVDHALELTRLSPGELAVHPAVAEVATAEQEATRPPHGREEVIKLMVEEQHLDGEIAREHAVLRSALRAILTELERLESEKKHHPGRLSGMLLMFGHHLARHFEIEESGWVFQASTGTDPATRKVAQHLLGEHRELEKKLARLIDAVERSALDESALLSDAFVEDLKGFLTRLAEHEGVENDLVQKLSGQRAASRT